MIDLAEALRAEGLDPRETDGWRGRRRPGFFDPQGVCVHHTASRPRASDPVPALRICIEGRRDLPGPLCNVLIGRDASVWLIAGGRANDTGMGSGQVLQELQLGRPPAADAAHRGLRDDMNLNPYFFDIEVENNGVGEPYAPEVIEALVACCAGICRAARWGAHRVVHHRETTRRKIDMSWRGDLRALVAARLTAGARPGVHEWEEKDMLTTIIDVITDGNGNGWSEWDPGTPIAGIVGFGLHGPAPWRDGYWHIDGAQVQGGRAQGTARPILSAQVSEGNAIVVIEGARPGSTLAVWCSVTVEP